MKFFLFIIFILILNYQHIFSLNENIIIFPLITEKINKINQNTKNTTEAIEFIFSESLITELEIGSPPQKVNWMIRPDETFLYFTSINHTLSYYDKTAEIINIKNGELNYFNENKSTSISFEETPYIGPAFYSNFNKGVMVKDCLRFNNEEVKLMTKFIIGYSIKYFEPGALGLQIAEKTSEIQYTPSLLYSLKLNKLIKNYKWFIYFDTYNKNNYLVIGCEPHEFINPITSDLLYKNFNIENDYFKTNDVVVRTIRKMQINFDDLHNNDGKFSETYKIGLLKYNIGIIISTENYRKYIEEYYLKIYIDNNKCFKSIFSQRSNYYHNNYYYYYCLGSINNELKESFNALIFKSAFLNENFELNFSDLFVKHNNYLIFLVVFSESEHQYWELGTPFTKKYQFAFDFDNNLIMYYKIKEENVQINLKNLILFIVILILMSGLLIITGIFFGAKLYGLKKKRRANELDDDFEYNDYKDNEKNENSDILFNNTSD